MSNYIYIFFFLINLVYSDSGRDALALEYAILHSKPDASELKAIESGDRILDGDILKINVQFSDSLNCYILYKDPKDNVYILYNSAESKIVKNPRGIAFGSTGKLVVGPPSGTETVHLLLSRSRLNKLEKIISDLNRSSGPRAKKFFKRFILEIEKLGSSKDSGANIASRLEKPVVGGVSFRGEEETINLFSLTHKATGEDIIIETITIDHRNLEEVNEP